SRLRADAGQDREGQAIGIPLRARAGKYEKKEATGAAGWSWSRSQDQKTKAAEVAASATDDPRRPPCSTGGEVTRRQKAIMAVALAVLGASFVWSATDWRVPVGIFFLIWAHNIDGHLL